VIVSNKSETELLGLYRRATIVFDWCMVGSERMPLEASLFGAILVTSTSCGCGGDFSDFPISSRYLYSGGNASEADSEFHTWITKLFEALYGASFWDHVPNFAPMRLRSITYSRQSMASEAARFYEHVTDSKIDYAQIRSAPQKSRTQTRTKPIPDFAIANAAGKSGVGMRRVVTMRSTNRAAFKNSSRGARAELYAKSKALRGVAHSRDTAKKKARERNS